MSSIWGYYEHSPFVDVSCRIQFPAILTIGRELPASFQERLRHDYPLFQATQDRQGYRLGSQDMRHTIVLTPDSLIVMTGQYAGWPSFESRVSAAVSALEACYHPAFCSRASVRFQGLLRPMRCGLAKIQWATLINPKMLGPFALPGHKGQLQGSRHEVVMSLLDSSDRFRLTHGFVEVRDPSQTNQPGEPAYLLDQDYFTTQRLEWGSLMATLDRFEREAGQFFKLCVSDQFHQAMVPKAA